MTEMRMILAVAAVLCSTTAFAQTDKPPMVGDKPLVQVKPKGAKAAAAKDTTAAPAPKEKLGWFEKRDRRRRRRKLSAWAGRPSLSARVAAACWSGRSTQIAT